jgi:hypothetical protein
VGLQQPLPTLQNHVDERLVPQIRLLFGAAVPAKRFVLPDLHIPDVDLKVPCLSSPIETVLIILAWGLRAAIKLHQQRFHYDGVNNS